MSLRLKSALSAEYIPSVGDSTSPQVDLALSSIYGDCQVLFTDDLGRVLGSFYYCLNLHSVSRMMQTLKSAR